MWRSDRGAVPTLVAIRQSPAAVPVNRSRAPVSRTGRCFLRSACRRPP
jgi:hypothetical protein